MATQIQSSVQKFTCNKVYKFLHKTFLKVAENLPAQ